MVFANGRPPYTMPMLFSLVAANAALLPGRKNDRIINLVVILTWLAFILDLVHRLEVLLEVGGIAQSNNW